MKKIIFSEQQIQEIIELYTKKQISMVKIGKQYNVSNKTIKRVLDKYDIKSRGNRKYFIKENIFNKIDSAEKAYWLGFILADGYINIPRKRVQIKLGEKDREHLLKFINFIGGDEKMLKKENNSITGNNIYYIAVNSLIMVKDLIDKNIFQGKSGKEKWYNVKEEFILDYIRGIIDGDGNINNKNFNICNSEEVLQNIKEYFCKKYNINNDIKILEHYNTKRLTICKNRKEILNDLYYKDCVCLERKRKIVNDLYCRD